MPLNMYFMRIFKIITIFEFLCRQFQPNISCWRLISSSHQLIRHFLVTLGSDVFYTNGMCHYVLTRFLGRWRITRVTTSNGFGKISAQQNLEDSYERHEFQLQSEITPSARNIKANTWNLLQLCPLYSSYNEDNRQFSWGCNEK